MERYKSIYKETRFDTNNPLKTLSALLTYYGEEGYANQPDTIEIDNSSKCVIATFSDEYSALEYRKELSKLAVGKYIQIPIPKENNNLWDLKITIRRDMDIFDVVKKSGLKHLNHR